MNWEIYTYGGGEYLATVFNAVAAITQNSNYVSLLALVSMIGLLWVIIEGAFGKELNYKWLLIMIFVYMGFMVPKSTVIVVDRINPAFSRVIANVPFGLAATAGTFSKIGDYLTRTFDTVFALPDDLSYAKTGMLFGQHLMMESTRFQVTDSRLAENLSEFWQACVFYDVLLGLYEWDALLSAPDTWAFIRSNTSQSRSFAYKDATGSRSNIIGCRAGAGGQLNTDLTTALTQAKQFYGARLGKGATTSAAAAQFASALPISYQQMTGMSMSAEQAIRQNWLANSLSQGFQNFATRVDAGAAAQDFAVARAESERRTTYTVLGELAGRTLPLIRNIFEAFIYGVFPLVFALMLLPAAGKVVLAYAKGLLWLQLWSPLYAILHFGMTLYSTDAATSSVSLLAGGSALSMATNTGLHQALADMSLIAGYLSMSIPMISYLMVNQGGAMMASLAGRVMGSYEAPAAKGAEETTTGNLSFGNTSLGNANWWAQNTAPSTNWGTYTHTDAMGTKHVSSAQGGEITQQQVSSYAFSASTGEAIKSSLNTQAGQSVQAARQDAVEYMASSSSTFSQMQNFSHQVQAGNSMQDAATQQQSSQLSQSLEKMETVARDFAAKHGIGYDTSVGLLAGASKGIGIDAKAGARSQELYDEAVKTANQTGFKENLQTATQLSHQLSATRQEGVSDTAAQQMQASLQQNRSMGEKASASLQRAENWSRVQARMEEHGFTYSGKVDNMIQDFSGMTRSQYAALQQQAEQGDHAAKLQLDGLVDRFVASEGYKLAGLEEAPAQYPVYNAYGGFNDAVTAQGQTGVAANQDVWSGQVTGAANGAGLDPDSAAPQGYQAVRDASQAGMAHDQGAVRSGHANIQQEAADRSGNIKAMADMPASEAALHRTSDNVLEVLPEPVGGALQFANKGITDMAATVSGVSQGVAGAVERAVTGREQDWGTDYQAGFDRVAGSDMLGTPAGTTQNIYNDLFGGEAEKKSLMNEAGQATAQVGGSVSRYDPIIREAAERYALNPNIIRAMMKQESGGDPHAVSHKGAGGLMQLMPATAAEVARQEGMANYDRYDPRDNIMMGAAYMKQQMDKYGGDLSLALAAYNAGPGAVDKHGGIPPYKETQAYVAKISKTFRTLEG